MSAPKTDLDKQEKQHRVPLLGMGGMVLWAAVLLVALVVFLALRGNSPSDDGASVEGVPVEAPAAASD